MRGYRDLDVWQVSMEMVPMVYGLTHRLPSSERFGLIQQLRSCAISVPSNIAEGWGRGSNADFARFLKVARGSVFEVETQSLICLRLEYVTEEQVSSLLHQTARIGKMLTRLINKLS